MYLHYLKPGEKQYFLDLAYLIANCDNNYIEEERLLINSYMKEMELDQTDYQIRELELDLILDNLDQADSQNKDYMFVELIILVMSDFDFDGREQVVIEKIRKRWEISAERYEEIIKIYRDLGII